jgi:DNA primase
MDRRVVPVPTPRGLIRFEDQLAADIRILSLPAGRDPDEVIRERPTRWAQLMANAKPVMDYYFGVLTADLDLGTAWGKSETVRRLGPLVNELGDRVQRTHYLQQLARMVQTDESALLQEISRLSGAKKRRPAARPEERPEATEPAHLKLDEHCLSYLLHVPELLPAADEALGACGEQPLGAADLSEPQDRALLDAWRAWLAAGEKPEARGAFYDTLDGELQARLDILLRPRQQEPPVSDDLLQNKVLDAITSLRLRNLQRRNQQLRFMHEDARSSGDREAYRAFAQQNIELAARIGSLQQAINARSVSGRRQRVDVPVRVPVAAE